MNIKNTNKVLFIGNSLLLGMFNKYGMCASSPEKDYAYFVQREIKKHNPDCIFTKLYASGFEHSESMEAFEDWFKQAEDSFSKDLGLIFIQLGDNVNTDEKILNFNKTADIFLERIKKMCPYAKIAWIHAWFNKRNTIDKLTELCARQQIEMIDISDIRTEENEARSGQICENEYGEKAVVKDAWITHPGDGGMKKIADRIIESLEYEG